MLRKFWVPWMTVPGLIIVTLVLGVIWFFSNFEKEEYEFTRDVFPEARMNPLLAAEKYLQRMDHPAESIRGIEVLLSLPSTSDALLIRHTPAGLSKAMSDNLERWIHGGGHLLLLPGRVNSDHPEAMGLLERLGVHVKKGKNNCGCPDNSEEDSDDGSPQFEQDVEEEESIYQRETKKELDEKAERDDLLLKERLIDLNLSGNGVVVFYSGGALLEDINGDADFRIGGTYRSVYVKDQQAGEEKSDLGIGNAEEEIVEERLEENENSWLLQYGLGEGKITVLSDLSVFFNGKISDHDHAFFLSWLLREDHKIWLLYSVKGDSLFTELWLRSPLFWIMFSLFLLLAIWRMQKRSGTLLVVHGANHRNILAHIEATGFYSWRQSLCSNILESNRKNLFTRWSRLRLGGKQQIDSSDQIQKIAEKAGITEEEYRAAFTTKVRTEQDLIRVSREMMKIQKHIQSGEQPGNE